MSRASDDQYGIDLNTALIGEDNQVEVRMIPYLESSGESLTVGTIRYTAEVQSSKSWETQGGVSVEGAAITSSEVDSAYKEWKKKAGERWAKYRSKVEQGAMDSMRAWASRNPMTVTTTFDNEAGPDFSKIFEEAPVISDTARVKDYAVRLRDLLRAGDAEALYRQMRPSISEETGWFKVTREGSREAALTHIREEWMGDSGGYRTDFPRSKIRLRRWSGGRVWELYVIGPTGERRAFFSEGPGAAHLEVYVGEIDGQLRIVRLT